MPQRSLHLLEPNVHWLTLVESKRFALAEGFALFL